MQSAQRNTVRLAIVSPMANEGESAPAFVEQVLSHCKGFHSVEHFVVLDNVSKDNTRELLDQYARKEPRLRVVWAPENRCVVDAYVRGYREAIASGADWILEIDAGFSHKPSQIPAFFDEMEKGFECVFATRFSLGGKIEDSSGQRTIVSRAGTVLTNLVLGTKLTDMTSGFQLFKTSVLQRILDKGLFSRGPFFQTEMKAYCTKLRVSELPITYSAASHGVSSGHIKESFVQLRRLRVLKRSKQLFI